MRAQILAALLIALTGSVARAAPSPCDNRRISEGPVPVGFSQADFGVVRSACPRPEVGLAVDGRAIIENANFYGNIRAASRFDVSITPIPQLELFASIEPLAYQLVIQSFRADHLGIGDTSVGGTLLAFARERFALSVMTRLEVPTAIGYYKNSWPAAVEAGILLVVAPLDQLRVRGGLLGGAKLAFTKAASDDAGAIIANAGADFVAEDWIAITADLNGQVLERGALDHLSLGLGLRFVIVDAVGLEVGANLPVAGDERNLAAFILRVAYRLD